MRKKRGMEHVIEDSRRDRMRHKDGRDSKGTRLVGSRTERTTRTTTTTTMMMTTMTTMIRRPLEDSPLEFVGQFAGSRAMAKASHVKGRTSTRHGC